jgi:hypothetical protein
MSSVIARSVIDYCKYDRQLSISGNLKGNYKFESSILVPAICENIDLEICVGTLQRAYLRRLAADNFATVYDYD